MNRKPLILLTNDDGILSPGLLAAAEAVDGLGELCIVAPHTQQTGMGRAFPRTPELGIIEETPILVNGRVVTGYGVYGSPAFSVAYGVLELASRKPDLCISGINYGENVGMVLTCSGTVGAVLEACSHGIPGIAVSLEAELSIQRSTAYSNMDWSFAKKIVRHWTERFLEQGILYDAPMLNINIPFGDVAPSQYRITRQSRQNYYVFQKPAEKRDYGKPFSLTSIRHVDEETLENNSDIYALYVDRISSVTPLTWDMSMG